MPSAQAERQDRRVKWALLLVSLGCLVLLAIAFVAENIHAEWIVVREGYAARLAEKADDDRGRALAEDFEVRIVQHIAPAYGTTDRCVTCHAGVDDPRMSDVPQPYTAHPGRWVELHPPEQLGCTVCHGGQGLATTSADAHGEAPFWDHPLLPRSYLYSSCAQCHGEDRLFGPEGLIASGLAGESSEPAALLALGRSLARSKGCLGCHKLGGVGGMLGPALDLEGEKTAHDFDFSSYPEAHTPAEWLRAHFLEPDAVSPGTVMPATATDPQQADALTAYMLSLRTVRERVGVGKVHEQVSLLDEGAELYALYCSACHGADGVMGEVPDIWTPSLRNADAQAVAGDDFYRHIVSRGKSGTDMPAWHEDAGGLRRAEIDALVAYLRGWQHEGAETAIASATRGDVRRGRAYYQGLCANCHGYSGEGGLGNALRPDTFLALAPDDFLARTIVEGRPGTAMPAWKHLSTQAVSDLLAYLRSWQPVPAPWEEVQDALARADPEELVRHGAALYRGSCASCHGAAGEGAVGPSLAGANILGSVDDLFLYRTLREGRPGTAMPAWPQLSARKLAGLIAYLRSWSPQAAPLAPVTLRGDAMVGEVHYLRSCAGCHGAEGEGGMGPQLVNPVFLDTVSDAALLEWIGRGRDGTAMLGFLPEEHGVTRLEREDIANIVAWLRATGSGRPAPVRRGVQGDAVLGGELYASNCAACHGPQGEGASGPQLNNRGFLHAASDGFLLGTLAMGRTGTAMLPMVKGSGGLVQIEPERLHDIVAFLRTWEEPEGWRTPRSLAEQSAPAIEAGRTLFAQLCSSCHGPNGKGSQDGEDYFAPALNNPEFLAAASDGFLVATIARGRQGTPMRAFGAGAGGLASLRAEEIADIVSFIRSWAAPNTADSQPRGGNP